ncbi:MAG: hypothetical protein KDD66_03835 [Bdellovibrionales bacterium]|nr:hypothetical protein [Bdellovibrionales bacterium]
MSVDTIIQTGMALASTAARYLPEPATTGVGLFRDVMNAASSLGGSDKSALELGVSGEFSHLINLQLDAQREMQQTTMVSNIERSKHESKMAALRNVRVG